MRKAIRYDFGQVFIFMLELNSYLTFPDVNVQRMTKSSELGKENLMRLARGEENDCGIQGTKFHEVVSSSQVEIVTGGLPWRSSD